MALYKDGMNKLWLGLDDLTFNTLPEFETCSEAEDNARSHGQSVLITKYDEYHALVD